MYVFQLLHSLQLGGITYNLEGNMVGGCIDGCYKVEKLYFSTYKENEIDYPCLKLGEHITIGKEWGYIYKIMRPGAIISTNDVLRMYESEK